MDVNSFLIYAGAAFVFGTVATLLGHAVIFLWVYFFKIEDIVKRMSTRSALRQGCAMSTTVLNWWGTPGLWGLRYPWARKKALGLFREANPGAAISMFKDTGNVVISRRKGDGS